MRVPTVALMLVLSASALAEPVKVATYNVERFMSKFDQFLLPERAREQQEQWDDEEDLYEIARTIKLPDFDADIIAFEEAGTQPTLEMFNHDWLGGKYAFVRAFETNSPGQHVAIMAKPGFEVLEVRDQVYLETDPVKDDSLDYAKRDYGGLELNRLFPRGPGFVKFRTPGGQVIWVGATHVKSKGGNSRAVTAWRIREVQRTRDIVLELASQPDVDGVIMLGDFNDDFGQDRYEEQAGADAVATMLAPQPNGQLVSPTQAYVQQHPDVATYHCEIKPPRYRSFIDHVFVTQGLANAVQNTQVISDPIAAVASDHYPVVVTLELD